MRLDGRRADEELLRDLAVAQAPRGELKHLDLAPGEGVPDAAGTVHEPLRNLVSLWMRPRRMRRRSFRGCSRTGFRTYWMLQGSRLVSGSSMWRAGPGWWRVRRPTGWARKVRWSGST